MFKKFVCPLTKEELETLYVKEGKTQTELCEIVGVKSLTTMSKILHENGIDTNRNAQTALKNRKGMTETEFKEYLITEYQTKSINQIAKELDVTSTVIRRYLIKYGIELKPTKTAQGSVGDKNPRWNGGRRKHNGYIEVYSPNHPRKNIRNCVYEHQLVMEAYIGRYLVDGEVVHHKDFCKTNNNIDNLQLLTNSEHVKLHMEMKRADKK